MITYITAFIFYTLAMVGVLIGGFVIYKKTIMPIKNETKGIIKVIDTYVIAPKKTLMAVRVRDEYFLIALDNDRTTFLSKLDIENKKAQKQVIEQVKEETADVERDIEQEIKDMLKTRQNRFDDVQKTRNDEIQKQFMELYQKDEPEAHKMQTDEVSKRKQIIRQLIKELNSDKTAGSKF